ncbi:MAG: hypothetical protein AABW50_04125 [Nanoarchaeota archaeon]
MRSENLVYIRLGYQEGVQARRDILKSQMNAVKIAQALKKYKILRVAEIELKELLHKKARDFNSDVRKMKALLPKLKIPKILEEEEIPEKTITLKEISEIKRQKIQELEKKQKPKKEEIKPKDNLEIQLREIQEKLNSLG